jgi:hypothetical protein
LGGTPARLRRLYDQLLHAAQFYGEPEPVLVFGCAQCHQIQPHQGYLEKAQVVGKSVG